MLKITNFAKNKTKQMLENENEILTLLSLGNHLALEKLYLCHAPSLFNFLMKFSHGNQYLSEEIVQKTFIKIWETREKINPNKSFLSYLCTIAKNLLLNIYEHETVKYIYQEYSMAIMPKYDNSTEKDVDKRFLDDYINKIVEELPPARKKVFIMSRFEMKSIKEIAQELGISESTVQTQLQKALAFLKEKLVKHYTLLTSFVLLGEYIINDKIMIF